MIAALATDENLRILVDSYLTNTGVFLLDRVEDYIKAEGPMSYRHLELNPPEGLSSSEARAAIRKLITEGKVFINGDLRIAIKPATLSIIVNGKTYRLDINSDISYEDIVRLVGLPVNFIVSITFRGAFGDTSGILNFGESVVIKDGTIFNAYVTGNA